LSTFSEEEYLKCRAKEKAMLKELNKKMDRNTYLTKNLPALSKEGIRLDRNTMRTEMMNYP